MVPAPSAPRPATSAPPGRVYAGRSLSERRRARRERMLVAGLELFGTLGWSASTVERLCSEAGVATRALYEEFSGREQLLLGVYERITAEAAARVQHELDRAGDRATDRIEAGVTAYVQVMTADPRRARVAHREVRAAGVLEESRRAAVVAFAAMIQHEARSLPGSRPGVRGRLLALSLAGAVNELLVEWTANDPPPPPALLVETLVPMFVATLT